MATDKEYLSDPIISIVRCHTHLTTWPLLYQVCLHDRPPLHLVHASLSHSLSRCEVISSDSEICRKSSIKMVEKTCVGLQVTRAARMTRKWRVKSEGEHH